MKPHTINPKLRYACIARAEIAANLAQKKTRTSRENAWKNICRDIRRGRSTFGDPQNPLLDKLILSLGQSVLHKPDLLGSIVERAKRNITALQEAGNTVVFVVEYEEKGARLAYIGPYGGESLGNLMPSNPGTRSEFLIFAGITSGDANAVETFVDSILPRKPKSAAELMAIPGSPEPAVELPFQKFVMVDTGKFMCTDSDGLSPVQDGPCLVDPEHAEQLRPALLGLGLRDFEVYIWGSCLCWDDLSKNDQNGLVIKNVQSERLQQRLGDIRLALQSLGWGLETAPA